jgi:Flp pilus assembly pilin Flp
VAASARRGETAVKSLVVRLVREDAGQDLVEYAFLTGLIALVAYAGVTTLGGIINTYYGTNLAGSAPFAG